MRSKDHFSLCARLFSHCLWRLLSLSLASDCSDCRGGVFVCKFCDLERTVRLQILESSFRKAKTKTKSEVFVCPEGLLFYVFVFWVFFLSFKVQTRPKGGFGKLKLFETLDRIERTYWSIVVVFHMSLRLWNKTLLTESLRLFALSLLTSR